MTVIDRRNHHLFQPLLYQVATAALSPAEIAAPIRAVLGRYRSVHVLLDEVVGIGHIDEFRIAHVQRSDGWSVDISRQVPAYRSIHSAIDITTAYKLLGAD